jgi:hypothetical protein
MREDHPTYPHCDREQMEKEREFDSFIHVVFLSRRHHNRLGRLILTAALSAFDRAQCLQFRVPEAFPWIL